MKTQLLTLGFVLAVATIAHAQPTVNGSVTGDEAFYGAALSTQNTRTGFGDNSSPDPIVTADGGSEINQVFGAVANGRLYVMITGNLETNFNKIEVFLDSKAGGFNSLDGASLPERVDGFCCDQVDPNETTGEGALQRLDGLTFDSGFDADYYLTFSNGNESVGGDGFWAINSHFADLQGGTSQALGIQTAPRGLPQVLRNPMDYNGNGAVDAADYTVWRDAVAAASTGPAGDGNGDGAVDQTDYDNWAANFGADASLAGPFFAPSFDFQTTEVQLAAGNTLPGLTQGQLIDRDYALSVDGGCTDDTGAGCVAAEIEFVLDVAPGDPTNTANHRHYVNTVDLEMGFDNSNVDGVLGDGGDFGMINPEAGEAESATTGLEFSIPLSEIGDPTEDIRLVAFVNNGAHDFFANQFAGEGILDLNLGNLLLSSADPQFTLADFPGNQFVTIAQPLAGASVPEPTALVLAALAAMGVAASRRR